MTVASTVTSKTSTAASAAKQFLMWFAVLVLITVGCIVWLRHDHVNVFERRAWQEIPIGYSPLLAALATILMCHGARGRELTRSLTTWRVSAYWYALVIVFPLLLMLASHFIVDIIQGKPLHWPATNWLAPLGSLPGLFSGSFGEEPGWRGYALPLLQKRLGVLKASIILGVIWGLWHMNAELTTAHPLTSFLAGAPKGLLRMIATAVLYGWLYDRSGGSLPVVMLAHAGHNIAVDVMPFYGFGLEGGVSLWVISGLYALAALPVGWMLWREDQRRAGNPSQPARPGPP
jgi:membrane protease YdiL (CAAX protease family)